MWPDNPADEEVGPLVETTGENVSSAVLEIKDENRPVFGVIVSNDGSRRGFRLDKETGRFVEIGPEDWAKWEGESK